MGQSDTLTEPTLHTLTGSDLIVLSCAMRDLPHVYDDAIKALEGMKGVDWEFEDAIVCQLRARRALASFWYMAR